MGKRQFYTLWLAKTFIKPLLLVDLLAGLLAIIFGAIIYYHPAWGGTMNFLLWSIPLGIFVASVVVGFILAPYHIYKDKERKHDCTKFELNQIKNTRPNIVNLKPEIDLRPTQRDISGVVLTRAQFATVSFANNASNPLQAVDAPNITGHICISGQGRRYNMIGRWGNTKQQNQGALPSHVQELTLHPNGNPEPLLIALKYLDDDLAYGLNVDNEKFNDWRDNNKILVVGSYNVEVHLKGINVDNIFCFALINKGKGKDIELVATDELLILDKGNSRTE